VLLCIYRVLLKGKKNVHYIEELKQQSANWVGKKDFWLFGATTFKDGRRIHLPCHILEIGLYEVGARRATTVSQYN